MFRPLLLALVSASLLAAAPEPRPRIAITIDDLPGHHFGTYPAADATRRILGALKAHHVKATGFVNCDRQPAEVLPLWLEAGMELGNHHATHANLNQTDPDEWLDGVTRCQASLAALTGSPPRFFRYPYLFNGPTPEIRDRVAAAIRAQGLAIARVSVDDHEWKLGEQYHDALVAKDAARAAERADRYVEHVIAATRHFQELAREKVGRDVAHVLLLHDNALEADHLDRLLTALEREGFAFVPLDEALADPVYALPNTYDGKWGLSWLYRIPGSGEDGWLGREWERLFPGE